MFDRAPLKLEPPRAIRIKAIEEGGVPIAVEIAARLPVIQ